MAHKTVIPCENCGRDAQINVFSVGTTDGAQNYVVGVSHICASCYESEDLWWEGVPKEDRIPSIPMFRRPD